VKLSCGRASSGRGSGEVKLEFGFSRLQCPADLSSFSRSSGRVHAD
jgi:hypothetical protein